MLHLLVMWIGICQKDSLRVASSHAEWMISDLHDWLIYIHGTFLQEMINDTRAMPTFCGI